MADRVKYDEMLEEEMFPHVLTLNPQIWWKYTENRIYYKFYWEPFQKKKKSREKPT